MLKTGVIWSFFLQPLNAISDRVAMIITVRVSFRVFVFVVGPIY